MTPRHYTAVKVHLSPDDAPGGRRGIYEWTSGACGTTPRPPDRSVKVTDDPSLVDCKKCRRLGVTKPRPANPNHQAQGGLF